MGSRQRWFVGREEDQWLRWTRRQRLLTNRRDRNRPGPPPLPGPATRSPPRSPTPASSAPDTCSSGGGGSPPRAWRSRSSSSACTTRQITDRLGSRPSRGDLLDRAADVIPEVAPAAIVGCGDDALGDGAWDQERERYQQFLDEYPDHDLAADAERGIDEAETAIELDRLRELVQIDYDGAEPAYCDEPAPYRGADPYRGGGPHAALLFGQSDHASELPGDWLADDPAEAVLVIRVGGQGHGSVVETCPCESDASASGYTNVTFHSMELSVRVHEVRTRRRLDTSTVEVGDSCPAILTYEYYDEDRIGPGNARSSDSRG
ncbi:tetratricopeptide repeat protein [Streptomyces sp. SBT349]|uniref:tetratricopeptide repeat protein n=1 Tax=Streptomyces sp. SBT349 TaxID=1580539 RepID=UPI00066BA41B|nr:hypothetical protein [Streptomyces sp. SBT349]